MSFYYMSIEIVIWNNFFANQLKVIGWQKGIYWYTYPSFLYPPYYHNWGNVREPLFTRGIDVNKRNVTMLNYS